MFWIIRIDSYALLAYFQAELAGMKVRDILKDCLSNHGTAYLLVISLGEIYYIIARKMEKKSADANLEDIYSLPVELIDLTKERVLAAARIKAHYAVSYADAFVIAAAVEYSAIITTGYPEFKETESLACVLWLDSPGENKIG
ncbi:MAG TPA: type II toxin-antitoxin system VapC family toxin [Desulfobacteraceae bacterium]|nr:type II toxin-antitoxin system VapC family toxin [Desulfobacteraceae bacterium]HPJ69116.1 type II toxin-antitoxin system VapC family toxin [Desulfobacteraceae bacterium]HPQ27712.1 type II toxin-antitoxin system VapC family toxin [Desulfobacteraceae bacterium]